MNVGETGLWPGVGMGANIMITRVNNPKSSVKIDPINAMTAANVTPGERFMALAPSGRVEHETSF